jgi:hypothetical protein
MRGIAYGLTAAGLALGSLAACGGDGGAAATTPGAPGTEADAGTRTISFGERAGGLTRDHAGETANQALLEGLTTTPAMNRHGVGRLRGALYGPHVAADSGQLIKVGPEQFLVAAADGAPGDPRAALRDILGRSTGTQAGGTLTDTDPGPLGGAASCLSLPADGLTVNACYWADSSTFGSVTSFAKDVTRTAEQMRKIRIDVERPS